MLYVAPESLTKSSNVEFLQGIKISFYAVDEAHCISGGDTILDLNTEEFGPSSTRYALDPLLRSRHGNAKVQHDIQRTWA